MLRIGMLTSGGDCQALNAAMRGVVKGICSKRDDVEIFGFQDGYKGLIYGDFKMLTSKDFSGILTQGGTILGTSRQPFKLMREPDANGLDKVAAMKHTYHKLSLNCLVILGGNGTHKTANLLREEGLNVITLPKTIDNDLWGTDMTFGFQSAVDIATDTIDRIHTTATSHSRVFIIEVMGHKVGHVTLHAGIAGGADVILIPEIPYDIDVIANVIQKRTQAGKTFTILAVAEGAISKEDAKLKKKEYKEKLAKRKYPSIAYELAEQIEKKTDKEVRITARRFSVSVRPCILVQSRRKGCGDDPERRIRIYGGNAKRRDGKSAAGRSGGQIKICGSEMRADQRGTDARHQFRRRIKNWILIKEEFDSCHIRHYTESSVRLHLKM